MDDEPVYLPSTRNIGDLANDKLSGDLKDPKGKADFEKGYATVLKFL